MSCEVEAPCPVLKPAAEEDAPSCNSEIPRQGGWAVLDRATAILNPSHHESPCNTAYDIAGGFLAALMGIQVASIVVKGAGGKSQLPQNPGAKTVTPRGAATAPPTTSTEAKNAVSPDPPIAAEARVTHGGNRTRQLTQKHRDIVRIHDQLPAQDRDAFLQKRNVTKQEVDDWRQGFNDQAAGKSQRVGGRKDKLSDQERPQALAEYSAAIAKITGTEPNARRAQQLIALEKRRIADKFNVPHQEIGNLLSGDKLPGRPTAAMKRPVAPSRMELPADQFDAAMEKYLAELAKYNASSAARFVPPGSGSAQ